MLWRGPEMREQKLKQKCDPPKNQPCNGEFTKANDNTVRSCIEGPHKGKDDCKGRPGPTVECAKTYVCVQPTAGARCQPEKNDDGTSAATPQKVVPCDEIAGDNCLEPSVEGPGM